MSGVALGNSNSNNSGLPSNGNLLGGGKSNSVHLPKSTSTTNSTSRLLKDVYEAANNLPKKENLNLGAIQLTLTELRKKSNELRLHKDGEPDNFTKAHYLLASSGISAEDIENDLVSIERLAQSLETVTPRTQIVSSNMDTYFSTRKDENILATIEQSLVSASTDFNHFINENITIDWRTYKDELRKSLGVGYSRVDDKGNVKEELKEGSVPVIWNKSIPGNYNILTPLSSHRAANSIKNLTREKFESYASIIYQLNEARLEKKFFPIALSFEELSKLSTDLKSKQVCDAWRTLILLTDEKNSKFNQEQKFFDLYQSKDYEKSTAFKKRVIANSKVCLEEQFYNYMDEVYTKDDNKKDYLPPTNLNKVSFFIKKVIMENNPRFIDHTLSINGTPIWALIFYLLRSGLHKDALNVVTEYKDLFMKFDKNFPIYLRKFIENDCFGLPPELNDRMNIEFSQQFSFMNSNASANFDAYKYSVYKIIGKCDLSKKTLPNEINLSIEDWLWFHLSIINEFNSNLNSSSSLIFENYTLQNLRKKIISLGPRKFNSSSNNPLYLKTLMMVGLYELAVQYTFESLNEYDAVHLAIGLCYYGLLRVSELNSKDELLMINLADDYEINFSRLLGSYTRFFKVSDPKVACQYLILIAMSKGGNSLKEVEKCHEALRELILISREFSLLLGKLDPQNGSKVPGILERHRSLIHLPNLEEFYQKIIEVSAVRCEEEGRIFDALLLYQLCQEFDTVVSLINRLLGELLSTVELDKPLIDYGNYENISGKVQSNNTINNNIILLSQHLMKVFNNNSYILSKISGPNKRTCDTLIPIVDIRDQFLNKNWKAVIHGIKELNILPIDSSYDLIEIKRLAESTVSLLDDNLIKVIPSLLIMTMTSISQLNYSILSRNYSISGGEKDELTDLRLIAKNCMIYAGIVQYKMPRETYSLLINLESLL